MSRKYWPAEKLSRLQSGEQWGNWLENTGANLAISFKLALRDGPGSECQHLEGIRETLLTMEAAVEELRTTMNKVLK
ncbi:MAG TPA: hypothetical protein VGQ24_09705 [Gemmatimonadales bacterium]|nr:hypothetical protein [Gemmatimonadales bacterium]